MHPDFARPRRGTESSSLSSIRESLASHSLDAQDLQRIEAAKSKRRLEKKLKTANVSARRPCLFNYSPLEDTLNCLSTEGPSVSCTSCKKECSQEVRFLCLACPDT